MTRAEARCILYDLINSGVLNEEYEDGLQDIAICICDDTFEGCETDARCEHGYPNYCEGCKYLGGDDYE